MAAIRGEGLFGALRKVEHQTEKRRLPAGVLRKRVHGLGDLLGRLFKTNIEPVDADAPGIGKRIRDIVALPGPADCFERLRQIARGIRHQHDLRQCGGAAGLRAATASSAMTRASRRSISFWNSSIPSAGTALRFQAGSVGMTKKG